MIESRQGAIEIWRYFSAVILELSIG